MTSYYNIDERTTRETKTSETLLMLYNFPSNFVFYTKVKDHEQLKKKLLPQIYANESGITYKGEYQDSITNYFEENNILLDWRRKYIIM